METTDFSFELPEQLIAQHPSAERGKSRLLVLNRESGTYEHRMCAELADIIEPGSLLVFNDSRVRKARLFARVADSDSLAEFLLIERLGPCRWKAMAKKAKRRRAGSRYVFAEDSNEAVEAKIEAEENEFRILNFSKDIDDAWLDVHGHIPLPPYIRRPDDKEDDTRYQTVYAKNTGSAAAPTAGLHFTEEILARLEEKGIEKTFVTLHVGLGTFLPVRTRRIEEHVMHEEAYSISEESALAVESAKLDGRPVVAVGTTSVRTLESAWEQGRLKRGEGRTSIFIYPGYRFKVVDRLFTNFHTPESTLLMLVSAFAGKDTIMKGYDEAIRNEYRFFSYGDAMFIR